MRSEPKSRKDFGERSREDYPLTPHAGPTPALVVVLRAQGAGRAGGGHVGGGSPARRPGSALVVVNFTVGVVHVRRLCRVLGRRRVLGAAAPTIPGERSREDNPLTPHAGPTPALVVVLGWALGGGVRRLGDWGSSGRCGALCWALGGVARR